jgi:branched-subunit amino acid aminotransferase/4-amino-4-deoxychorismate lyase
VSTLAWIGDPAAGPRSGLWGAPGALSLPLDDRGLGLADGLFETVRVENGHALLLREHLERWDRAAALLAMAPPPASEAVEALLAEAVARSGQGDGALRLNWSRGAAAERGIALPPEPRGSGPSTPPGAGHRFWLQFSPGEACFRPVSVLISRLERRNASSQLSGCKTFAYGPAIQARREAQAAGADDALLLSTAGGLCCGTTANLLVRRRGHWRTPPLAGGCLPGVMRGRALGLGLASEGELNAEDLLDAEAALLINSLGCRPITALDGAPLVCLNPTEAEAFWRRML